MSIKRTMYFLIATLALLFFTFAAQGEGRPFITRWKAEANKELLIPIVGKGYKLVIKKTDGTVILTELALTVDLENPYKFIPTEDGEILVEAGPEKVEFIRFYYGYAVETANQLLVIEKFGDVAWKSMKCAFFHCTNMQFAPTVDIPNLSDVTDMSYMFDDCASFNQPLNNWNVSHVTNMHALFASSRFNQPIENWDVSNVTDMSLMFYQNSRFNQPINNWKVGKVTNMDGMFRDCTAFDQPLENWDVSQVTKMGDMFCQASSFNQPLNNWKVSQVTDMSSMFWGCSSFNQPLDKWDVSHVTNMGYMFDKCRKFNQNLSSWKLNRCKHLTLSPITSNENYNKSLMAWSEQPEINKSILLEVDNLHYDAIAKDARTKLITEKKWIISGDVKEGGTVYDLQICGITVTSDNISSLQEVLTASSLLRNGKVSVSIVNNKPLLKLENAAIELTADNPIYGLYGKDDITIELHGSNSITVNTERSAISVQGVIEGHTPEAKLILRGQRDPSFSGLIRNCYLEYSEKESSSIRARYPKYQIEIENSIVIANSLIYVKSLALKNCSILEPEGAHFDANKEKVVDKDGDSSAKSVVIGSRAASVTLPTTLTLQKETTSTLKATVLPDNTVNKAVEWSSDNPEIATVDQNGKVTAKAVGKATITAKTKEGGYTATCEVTVTPQTTPTPKPTPNAVEDAVFANVIVSPNPFDTQLRISNGDVRGKYALYNTQGVEVAFGVLEGAETHINTASLPAGMYLLRLTIENGATKTFTVVKR